MKERTIACSDNLTIRQTVATFPGKVSILLFFTFLTRISFFMAWPFLSIILTRTYQLTPIAIGGLMSGCTIVSIIMGFMAGRCLTVWEEKTDDIWLPFRHRWLRQYRDGE